MLALQLALLKVTPEDLSPFCLLVCLSLASVYLHIHAWNYDSRSLVQNYLWKRTGCAFWVFLFSCELSKASECGYLNLWLTAIHIYDKLPDEQPSYCLSAAQRHRERRGEKVKEWESLYNNLRVNLGACSESGAHPTEQSIVIMLFPEDKKVFHILCWQGSDECTIMVNSSGSKVPKTSSLFFTPFIPLSQSHIHLDHN